MPMRDLRNQYPFRGGEELDLQAAMRLMGEMQDMDQIERQLERTQYGGDLDDIDADKLEELLGEEARETLDQLRQLLEILEEAGYIRKKGNSWELTPRGNRKIGERALAEIYANLKQQNFGKHNVAEFGRYGERADDSKRYEFGDPFHLDLRQTLMNSMYREGPQVPVSLEPGRLRGLSLRDADPDRDGADAGPLLVDGAAGVVPGGEEGRAGAEQLDPHEVRPRRPLPGGIQRLRAGTQDRGSAVRPLGRDGAGHEHAPRAADRPAAAVQAQSWARARSS